MFINIKILSKNKNSLTKFLVFLKNLCLKKKKKETLFIIKKNKPNKKNLLLKLHTKLKAYKYENSYKCKIKKRKYIKKKYINGLLSYLQKNQKQKVFTILKSPHVNKTAQEQIEYRLFSKQIIIISFQILKFLMLIKKIQTKIYPDIEIQIKFILNNAIQKKTKLASLNPENYKLEQFFLQSKKYTIDKQNVKQKIRKPNKKQTIFYLRLFDMYGELNFNNLFR